MTRRGRPKKGAAESDLQMNMTFNKEEFKGETLTNFNCGKRQITYRDCNFNGRCRTGAHCIFINPVINGVLRTGGNSEIVRPSFNSGVLFPGADNIIRN